MDVVLSNARLIRADHVHPGWLAIADGRIVEIGEGKPPERGFDCAGDYLLPGLVELHTDHLETHYSPRPGVYWNARAAVLAYDAQIAAAGITTVFDSLRIGGDFDGAGMGSEAERLADAIAEARGAGHMRADHRTHLRCEICSDDVIEQLEGFVASRPVDLISLMDHTPGQRQFRELDRYRFYYGSKAGRSPDELEAFIELRLKLHAERAEPQRARIVAIAHAYGVAIASHDDATPEHVAEAVRDKVAIAEFPTTVSAAAASHEAGIRVMMGAPNLVRGGSHSGNVAAEELARAGTLDIFSSDYVPSSLLLAAFELPIRVPAIDLATSVRTVTKTPAEATGLMDRGEIAVGRRADLVRVHDEHHVPVVRTVWREGARVA